MTADDLRQAEALSSSPEDEQTFNTEGVYAMRFWRDGKWRIVVVDDFVPMHPQDPSRFLFTSPSKSSAEIWCVIAEKAFAKLNGSYSVLDGGQAEEALEDLCGGVPFNFSLGSRPENKSGPYGSGVATAQADLWRDMMKWRDEESMVGVSWSNNGGTDKEVRMGCFGNHAYGVLAVFDITLTDGSHEKLVNVRNPHGHGGEYSGDWSDTDQVHWTLVTPEDRQVYFIYCYIVPLCCASCESCSQPYLFMFKMTGSALGIPRRTTEHSLCASQTSGTFGRRSASAALSCPPRASVPRFLRSACVSCLLHAGTPSWSTPPSLPGGLPPFANPHTPPPPPPQLLQVY